MIFLPLFPGAGTGFLGGDGGFVEQFVQGHGGFVLVALRHRAPELKGLLPCGVIHGRCVFLFLEVSDGVPVHDDIHSVLLCPFYALVHGLESLFPPHGIEVGRMHGKTHDVGPPGSGLGKIPFVPLSVTYQFDRIGEAEPAEDNLLPLRVYKLIPFHSHPGIPGRARNEQKQCRSNQDMDTLHKHN